MLKRLKIILHNWFAKKSNLVHNHSTSKLLIVTLFLIHLCAMLVFFLSFCVIFITEIKIVAVEIMLYSSS